jgi:hypothetical protein
MNKIIDDIKENKHNCADNSTQVERYGPYTAVISGAEIRPYHNEITGTYTVKIRTHIRHRIIVPNITDKYCPFTSHFGS